MFGVSDGGNRLVDGELVTWEIDPGMRDFLILMNKWYEEGLIDQEFDTIDRTKAWEKVAQGVVGSAAHAVYNYAGADYARGRPPNSFVPDEEIGTGAEVVMIPGPVGPTGIQGGRAYSAVSAVGNYSLFIGSHVSDEKLKKILEILNWTHGTDEGFIYFRYGKPGAHCDWEGEPWDSACILRDATDIPDDISPHGAIGAYPVYLTADRTKFFLPRVVADFYRDWVLADSGQQYTLRPPPLGHPQRDRAGGRAGARRRHAGDAVQRVLLQGDHRRHRRRRGLGCLRCRVAQGRWRRHHRRVAECADRVGVPPGPADLLTLPTPLACRRRQAGG